MKSTASMQVRLFLASMLLAGVIKTSAASPELLSRLPSGQPPASGGGGDSGCSIMTPDGRFVVFSSTAGNLVTVVSNRPLPAVTPPPLNVFLRDRLNGTTTLISVDVSGVTGGNGDSLPAGISTNGQFVVFESSADNLAAGDGNGKSDIFVRDVAAAKTMLVSANTNGTAGDGASRRANITPDGHLVTFLSGSTDLVVGDTNHLTDVFIRDLVSGITSRVNDGAGALLSNGLYEERAPEISTDGRYVVFQQTTAPARVDLFACDLLNHVTKNVAADALLQIPLLVGSTNRCRFDYAIDQAGRVVFEASPISARAGVLFRFDLASGSTEILYTNVAALAEDDTSLDLTPNGKVIVFVANADGLTNAKSVMRWDESGGMITLVSGQTNNPVAPGTVACKPSLSASGNAVAFLSDAEGLVTNSVLPGFHVYVRDITQDMLTVVDSAPQDSNSVVSSLPVPLLDADGHLVVFETRADDPIAGQPSLNLEVFAHNLVSGNTELVSIRASALPSFSPNGPSVLGGSPLSSDSRYLAFSSDASDLVDNDTNGMRDVFVRDRIAATNFIVSVALDGSAIGDGPSADPLISSDGRYVAFDSAADNLVAADNNHAWDVFVRDRQTGSTLLASIKGDGTAAGNAGSYLCAFSRNGRFVLFRSSATNLVSGVSSRAENLFLRDLQAGQTFELTLFGLGGSPANCLDKSLGWAMTPDGRFVAYLAAASSPSITASLLIWDSQAQAIVYTNSTPPTSLFSQVDISPDGKWIPNVLPDGFYALDWQGNTNLYIGAERPLGRSSRQFSADSRFLVYSAQPVPTDGGEENQIFLWDFVGQTNLLVSQGFDSGGAANGKSDSAAISPDGRYVAYRSSANDLVAGATNGTPQLFLYDRIDGTTTLMTTSVAGPFSAASYSARPTFSPDNTVVVFESPAADLTNGDFNSANDLFDFSLVSTNSELPFAASISSTSGNATIAWKAAPGRTDRVQFKNSLSDPTWQDLTGTIVIDGDTAYQQDIAPGATQRFYRIITKP